MTNHQNIALSRKQMSSDLSDEELILQVQEGNRNAFDVLVHRFKDRIYHFILKMVKDPELAEEIAQDAFVRAYINADKYRTIARFSTWLYTIALNLVRNHMRKQKRSIVSRIPLLYSRDSVPVEKEYQDSAPLPDHQVQNRELRERVGGILERISPHYLEPLLLREYGDMTYEEISAATGLKIGTVRSRINR
ncbi:MAG: sigma-70 family RNA polymerase sigma factor, partial [Candidatus Krumholzibacteria bacterium]|nr:sigma-70 family RNA polymerase sigma factor [Candidatus Krumholzibacteria bacterium]